ncbi:MAG: MarR family winged helix-turn-helix transcriptional regulator [Propionibacteriaceae bacterium]|jgi:DNA-binding MarR family transcriptional regulator|nr:MarR family winged helix-turn-helix transcriptional regulator [Propionibacteriaceae bacterium]
MTEASRPQLLAALSACLADLETSTLRSQMVAMASRPMTAQQLRVIGLLALEGSQRTNAVAKLLGVSAATTTGLLDRLENIGLVIRQSVAGDARGRLVTLTEAGRRVVRDVLRAPFISIDLITQGLTDDELAGLVSGIRGILREQTAAAEEAAPGQFQTPPGTVVSPGVGPEA